MLYIEDENLKELFVKIDASLSKIEVKGDSVQHLFMARNSIADLFQSIKEREEKKQKKNEGG